MAKCHGRSVRARSHAYPAMVITLSCISHSFSFFFLLFSPKPFLVAVTKSCKNAKTATGKGPWRRRRPRPGHLLTEAGPASSRLALHQPFVSLSSSLSSLYLLLLPFIAYFLYFSRVHPHSRRLPPAPRPANRAPRLPRRASATRHAAAAAARPAGAAGAPDARGRP